MTRKASLYHRQVNFAITPGIHRFRGGLVEIDFETMAAWALDKFETPLEIVEFDSRPGVWIVAGFRASV